MSMKWLLNRCRRNRDRVSLLASGRLPEPERATIESHLQTCAQCQRYYKEVSALNQRLEEWGKCLPRIEPSEALGARWFRAIQAAEPSMHPTQSVTGLGLLDWWHALRPHNRFALADHDFGIVTGESGQKVRQLMQYGAVQNRFAVQVDVFFEASKLA